jgi:hypothetical protein
MSTSEMLRPWVLGLAVAIGLTGCASLDPKDGVVGAGRGRLEPALERPALPGLDYDTTQGIQSQSLEKALGR